MGEIAIKARELLTDKELHQRYPNLSLFYINDARRRGLLPGVIKLPGYRKYLYDATIIDGFFAGQSLKLVK